MGHGYGRAYVVAVRSGGTAMSDDEKRPVRDLLDSIHSPHLYVWRGTTYAGNGQYEDTPAPEGGDTASQGAIDMCPVERDDDWRDGARYVEIPATQWGDYGGSTYERSNERSLARDYPSEIITVTSGFGGRSLVLPLDCEISEGLFEAVAGLVEYPLYDEGDESALCAELESEDWDSWGRSDFVAAVRKLASAEDSDDEVSELDDDDEADRLFWAAEEAREVYYQAETAVSGYWPDWDAMVEHVWSELRAKRERDLDSRARELSAPIPGQLALI